MRKSKKIKTYKNNITLHAVFGNMYRPRHALIVLKNKNGDYLLGAKPKFYPPDIYRLIGGGIDDNETPLEGAIREIKEELQIDVNAKDVFPLAVITTTGEFERKTYTNNTYLFLFNVEDQELRPSDDIEYLKLTTKNDFADLIKRYQNLKLDDWYITDGYKHCWKDYGEMYSFIHQIALDLTL